MADSFIQLSPDSTGKKVDTRTAPDGDHREVQVIGSPTTADVAEADTANGLDVDVTRLPALPAGTNNIGDVDIASLPNEGQQTMANSISVAVASDQLAVPVSAASLPLPTGAATAALQLPNSHDVTVDNAAGAAAVNIQDGGNSLTVDGAVSISGTVDTELPAAAALADNTANPTVPAVGSFLMAFDGTNWDRVQTGAATGGALKVDGSAVTQPVSAASLPLPAGAATSTLQTQPGVDIGDVTVNNAAGASAVNVQDGGNSLTVDGTVAVTGTVDTELPAAAALADATANPTTPLAGAALEMFNGTTWDRVRGDTTNGLDVDVTRLPALVAGTANIGDVDVLTVPAPLSTSGGGTEATALRVTLANDSTGLVSVDDNGGSLTVDGTVTANPTAKTVLSTGGSASGSGNNTLVAAGTNRLKVFAFSLTTLSTTAMTCIFQSGAGGTELWRVVLQAPTSVSTGANLSVAPPAWLFATASATLLNLNLSSANAVNWSVAYYDEV